MLGLLNAARLHAWIADLLSRLLRRAPDWAPLQQRPIGRVLGVELFGMGLVLAFAAVLGAAEPARGPAFDPAPPTQAMSGSSRADDLLVTLALKPNRPGQNFFTLGVFDTRRPAPAPIEQVRVQLQAQGEQPVAQALLATALGGGRYEIVDSVISHAGAWNVTVVVRRAGLPDATATLSWTVLAPARPVFISDAPLAPWTAGAALLVMLLCAALLGAWRLRRWLPSAQLKLADRTNMPEQYIYIFPEEKP